MSVKENIEFLTVAVETCSFLEQSSDRQPKDFVATLLKILPLLYLKTMLIDLPERYYEEDPERFVSELDYETVRAGIYSLLGENDGFLNTFDADMQLSETAVGASISELLTDVYQELKDYVLCCQFGNENVRNDALNVCIKAFSEHWGQKLLNALQALHTLFYSGNLESQD